MTQEVFQHADGEINLGLRNPQALTHNALTDALLRLPETAKPEARARIEKGIRNRFEPAVEESTIIAEQLSSPEYQQYVKETLEFLGGRKIGHVVCPDGRILPYFTLGDPQVTVFHQRLAGIPPTRPSSSIDSMPMPNDGSMQGSIVSGINSRKKQYPQAELDERIGLHINSDEPTHGCGAIKLAIEEQELPDFGMEFGGIDKYYSDLETEDGDAFYAFDNFAKKVPALKDIPSITFDISHDAYSQGIIFGLKDIHGEFDREKSLRENLLDMHRKRRIVMTELLDHAFHQRIQELDEELFGQLGEVDPLNPTRLAVNLIRIGTVARKLTLEQEQAGFKFIPEHLLEKATSGARRSLAYTLIRNVVYRKLANITPGAHALLEHNEEWLRIGYGGPLNIDKVSFVLRKPHGALSPSDIKEAKALYPILRGALSKKGVKPRDEAMIVVVGELFDRSRRASEQFADEDYETMYSTIGNNAANVRLANKKDIENGAMVVIGVIFGPDGTITEIVQ